MKSSQTKFTFTLINFKNIQIIFLIQTVWDEVCWMKNTLRHSLNKNDIYGWIKLFWFIFQTCLEDDAAAPCFHELSSL